MINKFVKPKIKEKQIQKAITDWLAWNQIFYWRVCLGPIFVQGKNGKTYPAPNSMKGHPDIAFVLPNGRYGAIEVKSEKGKLSPEQKIWIEQLTKNGALVIVARSLDDVIKPITEARGF